MEGGGAILLLDVDTGSRPQEESRHVGAALGHGQVQGRHPRPPVGGVRVAGGETEQLLGKLQGVSLDCEEEEGVVTLLWILLVHIDTSLIQEINEHSENQV